MKLSHVVEFAALVSANSAGLVKGGQPLPSDALNSYWRELKSRSARWSKTLLAAQTSLEQSARGTDTLDANTISVLEEVFVWEIFTRVWSGILTACDQERATCLSEPLARNTLVTHLEARRAAMTLMIGQSESWLGPIGRIDQLRRRAERWTDLLLGHLAVQYDIEDFAYDEDRCREFGEQQLEDANSGRLIWELVLVSLRHSFSDSQFSHAEPGTGTDPLIDCVLACFPENALLTGGPFVSAAVQSYLDRTSPDLATRLVISTEELQALLQIRYPSRT